jgi:hypothetical protein
MATHYRLTVENLISELGSALGISHLALSDHGVCTFRYQDSLDISIEHPEHSNQIFMYCPIVDLPQDESLRGRLCERLLIMHFMGLRTSGATFAIHQDQNSVILNLAFPIEMVDATRFNAIVSHFVPAAADLKADVDQWLAEELLTIAEDEPAMPISHHHRQA